MGFLADVQWLSPSLRETIERDVKGPWRLGEPRARVEQLLAWAKAPQLVEWFCRGDGPDTPVRVEFVDSEAASAIEWLTLRDALEWRRQFVRRDLQPPLSSEDSFLPIARTVGGHLIFDGRAGGVGYRSTKSPESYLATLRRAFQLGPLLAVAPDEAPPPVEEQAPSSSPPAWRALDELSSHLGLPGSAAQAEGELAAWSAAVGPTSLDTKWGRFLCGPDQARFRDEMTTCAEPQLRLRFRVAQGTPLIVLPRAALVAWSEVVRLHLFREGQWLDGGWTHCMPLREIVAAMASWTSGSGDDLGSAQAACEILEELLDVELDGLVRSEHGLARLPVPARMVLSAWFSSAEALAAIGVRIGSIGAEPTLIEDEVATRFFPGSGVALQFDGLVLPWSPTPARWIEGLASGWDARGVAGAAVGRDFFGNLKVRLPLTPAELADAFERDAGWSPCPAELRFRRAETTQVQSARGITTFELDDADRQELVASLRACAADSLVLDRLGLVFEFMPPR